MSQIKKDEHNRTKDADLWKEYGEDLLKGLPNREEVKYDNFQRKLDFIMDELKHFFNQKEKTRFELIVCASLLDYVPNFGHITRTSEIFKINLLVVPDIKILSDDQYKSISVTAEKW